jgi:hypothetical protein
MAPLTESQWTAVRTTLPKAADQGRFRIELEPIASDTVPPRKWQQSHLERALVCVDLIRELPSPRSEAVV